ncbi:MAG: hypothetical protein ACI8TP_002092 [Acidimicrobiales bacterium]|jgi:hypothetical protein
MALKISASTLTSFLVALALAASACGGGSSSDASSDGEATATPDPADSAASDSDAVSDTDSDASDEGGEMDDDDAGHDGGDDDDDAMADDAMADTDPELVAEISGSLATKFDYAANPADADCIASSVVSSVGAEGLAEAGVTVATPDLSAGTLSDEAGDSFVEALFDCVDVEQMMVDNMTGDDATADQARCVVDALGVERLKVGLKYGLLDSAAAEMDEFFDAIEDAGTECGLDMTS